MDKTIKGKENGKTAKTDEKILLPIPILEELVRLFSGHKAKSARQKRTKKW